MLLELKDKRRDKRYQVALPVIYSYRGEPVVNNDCGTTFLCFYTDRPLREGLALNLKIPHFWDMEKSGTVKWTSMKSSHCFKVGVSFQ